MYILVCLRTLISVLLVAVIALSPKSFDRLFVNDLSAKQTGIIDQNTAATFADILATDLWVDASNGNNSNNGLSPSTALRTIQRAADLAVPGTTIHIQPGIYRESIIPAQSGNASGSIRYIAEEGLGTVVIRGSEPSSSLTWTQLSSNSIGLPAGVDPKNVYYTNLSAWGLSGPPRFVVELDANGKVAANFPSAREPDWTVVSEWKHHEFWWAADGGSSEAGCYPPTDANPYECDAASRSLTQLTDRHNDSEPAGIAPGNLTTLGNLTGATLVVLDTNQGTFVFRRTIIAHDVTAGRVTVGQICEQGYGTGTPALGWGSKYYVEGLPRLLDSPGEWWYDQSSGRLYLWPRNAGNPASMNIEITRQQDGFSLKNRSYISLEALTFEFFNRNIIVAVNNDFNDKSHNDIISNAILRYGNTGVWLSQYVNPNSPVDCAIDGFTLENSEISYMDKQAINIYYSWGASSSSASFTRPGVLNTTISGNEMHHLGFNAESEGVGVQINFPDHLRFEGNYIHQVEHAGVAIAQSVIQSPNSYGFLPSEIKTGDILIRDNIFEKACQNHADCAALKITGRPPDKHVFRDLLVTGNIFRDTIAWTSIAEKRGTLSGGASSTVKGMGGTGFYVDNASGVYAYRNIAYNNAFKGFNFYGSWRDGDIIYYNNTIANSLYGIYFSGMDYDTHGNSNTKVVNNIIMNNEGRGVFLSSASTNYGNLTLDYNLYFNNGWRSYQQGGLWNAGDLALTVNGSTTLYTTLQDVQAGTSWEDHGREGTPAFVNYNINDHALFDGSWPDLHLTTASTNAIDKGVASLPASLTSLLNKFGIVDALLGPAYDIGRYELGFKIIPNPLAVAVASGGVAHYTLSMYPSDLPYPVTLTVSSPVSGLVIALAPTTITSKTTATLTITDTNPYSGPDSGLWYALRVRGQSTSFINDVTVYLIVNGKWVYLPLTMQK